MPGTADLRVYWRPNWYSWRITKIVGNHLNSTVEVPKIIAQFINEVQSIYDDKGLKALVDKENYIPTSWMEWRAVCTRRWQLQTQVTKWEDSNGGKSYPRCERMSAIEKGLKSLAVETKEEIAYADVDFVMKACIETEPALTLIKKDFYLRKEEEENSFWVMFSNISSRLDSIKTILQDQKDEEAGQENEQSFWI